MTDQAADAAIDQACRSLRLPTIRSRFAEIADREQLRYRGLLIGLLLPECDDRDRRRGVRRVRSARFRLEEWLSDFDYDANPALIHTLARCDWVRKGEPLCLIGDSGTGKAHLAKTIARYGRIDLLCIDEPGYMQLDRRGAELVFQVSTECEEAASLVITSNESFSG